MKLEEKMSTQNKIPDGIQIPLAKYSFIDTRFEAPFMAILAAAAANPSTSVLELVQVRSTGHLTLSQNLAMKVADWLESKFTDTQFIPQFKETLKSIRNSNLLNTDTCYEIFFGGMAELIQMQICVYQIGRAKDTKTTYGSNTYKNKLILIKNRSSLFNVLIPEKDVEAIQNPRLLALLTEKQDNFTSLVQWNNHCLKIIELIGFPFEEDKVNEKKLTELDETIKHLEKEKKRLEKVKYRQTFLRSIQEKEKESEDMMRKAESLRSRIVLLEKEMTELEDNAGKIQEQCAKNRRVYYENDEEEK